MDRILIIEDTHLFRLQIRKALENNGFSNITEFSSADSISQMPHLYLNDVILIILDIELPGISGIEFASQLKNSIEYCNIPVIFISSNSDSKIVHAAIDAGGIDYIAKPFKFDLFIQRVEKIMETYYGNTKGKTESSKNKVLNVIINEYERAVRAGSALSFLVFTTKSGNLDRTSELIRRSIRKIDSALAIDDRIIVALPLTPDKNANVVVTKLRDITQKNQFKLERVVSFNPSSSKSIEDLKKELFE